MALNVFIVMTAKPFNLLPKSLFWLYFFISGVSTYAYLFNYRKYSIFEYENLYFYIKKKSELQIKQALEKKREDPLHYYEGIIRYLTEHFPGVIF